MINLTGQRFGRLIVIGPSPKRFWEQCCWVCKCDCGVEGIYPSHNLRKSNTRSCGCYHKEILNKGTNFVHGKTHTPEYKSWCKLKERCNNPKDNSYKYCGDMGVSVAPEWEHNFPAFLAYIGPRPSLKHSIDRWPNPWGNYEPGNVRWATPSEQEKNQRKYHPKQ